MIEQVTAALEKCHGQIQSLDPQGKLQKRAQQHTQQRKATDEEYRLSDSLKTLTEKVEDTITNAEKRLNSFPEAKKDLSPILDMMRDPLFQILSAVGLLLNGVLGLLGKLLGPIGLGGITDAIGGALGLDKIVRAFGLGKYFGGKK